MKCRKMERVEQSRTAEKVYKDLLWQDPDRHSGDICFYGTRIPVQEFFDWLASGSTIDAFLAAFPQVGRERIDAVLALAGRQFEDLLEPAA